MLHSVLEKWAILHPNAEQFHLWFKNNKAKQFSESVISCVRQRIGLGCSPEKITTNCSERTNGVIQDFIKRECDKDKVDEYTFAKCLQRAYKNTRTRIGDGRTRGKEEQTSKEALR